MMKLITRRSFLQSSAALTIASALPFEFALADPLGLPIGIQLYTVGSDMQKDAAATVKKIAEIGYKEVETAGFGSAGSAAALRKLLDENGLKCPSAHLSFDLKDLNKAFDDAHALGCTYATSSVPRFLVLDMSGSRAEVAKRQAAAMQTPMSPDELKKMIDAMNQIGAAAKQQGLTFASHNHTYEFLPVDGKPAFYTMMAQTDPNNVKFEIDCGWATVAGYSPVELVNMFPGRVKMLHIKDFLQFQKGAAPGSPNSPKGAEIGHGVVNYKEIFAGMKGKGIEHVFVEQEAPFSRMPPLQAAEVDYKYLHSLS